MGVNYSSHSIKRTVHTLDGENREGVIRLGRAHTLDGSEAGIGDSVLHEIANPEARYGPLWKATARRIGATPHENVYRTAGAVKLRATRPPRWLRVSHT